MMKADVGDWLVLKGTTTELSDQRGVITEVRGADGAPPYVVRWLASGHEATVFPGSDALVVTAANSNAPTNGPGTGLGADPPPRSANGSNGLRRHQKIRRVVLGRVLRVPARALDDDPDARRARANSALNGRRCAAGRIGVHSGEGGARVAGATGSRRRTGFLDQPDVVMGARVRGAE